MKPAVDISLTWAYQILIFVTIQPGFKVRKSKTAKDTKKKNILELAFSISGTTTKHSGTQN